MRRFLAGMVGASLACLALPAPAGPSMVAEIRWTAFGVPHIRAENEAGLGYGIGYAYARDNLCLLAEEIVTARGERARFFGADGQSSSRIDNVSSDFFFRWLNDDSSVATLWQAQPEPVRQLLEGYAAGFNRYLRDTPEERRPVACAGREWLRPISSGDLLRFTRRLMIEGGLGQFVEAVLNAAPLGEQGRAALGRPMDFEQAARRREAFARHTGSNGIAIGRQLSDNGKGLLLANPHFPWFGALRFYQLHLSIPGRLDVMGAALPGLPLVNIGFNQHLAWTHTVDSSSHFTLHRLELNPQAPGHYRVDGIDYPLEKRTLSVEVRDAQGNLSTLEHSLYLSKYGPLVKWPGLLDWTDGTAYALHDANLENTRALQQWTEMNRATSLAEFRASIERTQGIPWVNTLASDEQGRVLYMNASVIPNLEADQLANCLDASLAGKGLPVLDGSRSTCDWRHDEGAAQPGIVPPGKLPVLEREDFVQNSNDSAWMTNPAARLTGFSPLVSRDGQLLSPRARFALDQLTRTGREHLDAQRLERLVTDNQVYLADLLVDDLLTLCPESRELVEVCTGLRLWSRRAGLEDGPGLLYFQRFAEHFRAIPDAWRIPFDPQDPVHTPRGIALDDPQVREKVVKALLVARDEVAADGVGAKTVWGELQKTSCGAERIPIPGGDGRLGIYNAIQARPASVGRGLEVVGGSSYIQLVRFTEEGPQARGLLAFSQSTDPASPHYRDQTRLFSRQTWQTIPFSEAQIEASSPSEVLRLVE
ncbi:MULTISPECIES: bifunctional acylase PvdQ [Azotobacter]|nr:acyl-homoserine-lactone acylase [Azotobacter vinelandii]